MISQNFVHHYENWSKKAESIDGDDLPSIYDRYMTYFVVYNNLYNQVPAALIAKGIPIPNNSYDNKKATEMVVKFLGAETILEILNDNGHAEDIQAIIQLIENEVFYIKLKHGHRQRGDDLKILDKLKSSNPKNKATAILEVCYYVRCNIFHGSKDFQEYQRLLIEPLTKILVRILNLLFVELSK